MKTLHPDTAIPFTRITVWDWPVRVFHGLLALCFAGAWLTAEREPWRQVHITLGYTFGGLLAFRLIWGLLGTRHARFTNFVRGPAAVLAYLKSLLTSRPAHFTGHNPAGAWAIVAMLGLGVGIAASGWLSQQDVAGEWLNELHEGLASAMLAVVAVHIAGVVVSSRLHSENLAKAMVTGDKQGPAEQGITRTWPTVAWLMAVSVLGFWAWQWQAAPMPQDGAAAPPAAVRHHHHRHDDDD